MWRNGGIKYKHGGLKYPLPGELEWVKAFEGCNQNIHTRVNVESYDAVWPIIECNYTGSPKQLNYDETFDNSFL